MKKKIDIAILQTGGTISSEGDDSLAPSKTVANEIEEKTKAIITSLGLTCEIVHPFHEKIYDSSDMSPSQWQTLNEHIHWLQYLGVNKFLILHGTDTMCYTASALCFATEGCTIALTGSQRVLAEDGFDGLDNIELAVKFLAENEGNHGVYVAFAGRVIPAPFCHKQDASGLDAFCDTRSEKREFQFCFHKDRIDLSLATLNDVEVVRLNPISLPNFEWLDRNYFGGFRRRKRFIVIFGFGTGNVPKKLIADLKFKHLGLAKNKLPIIVAASTCEKGQKSSTRYETGLDELVKSRFRVLSQGEYSEEFLLTLLSLNKHIEIFDFLTR